MVFKYLLNTKGSSAELPFSSSNLCFFEVVLAYAAQGANPFRWDVLKGCARSHTVVRIDPQTRVITQSPLKLHKGDDYLYAGTRLSYMTPAAEVPIRMTCYPNPFNPSTVIEYNTVKAGSSSLQIYNVKGQLVKTLWDGWQTEGSHKIKWDGNNENGEAVSSGIYFARLQTAEHQVMKKLMLLK